MKNMFKIASLLAAAVVLFACEETNTDGGTSGELQLISDKDVIQANGTDAVTFTVLLGDKDVTSSSTIYNEFEEEVLVDGKFTTTKVGEHKLYAEYGTLSTYKKNNADSYYVIKAINVAVPTAVADAQPENTKFVHRAFLTQYTGTGCGYCPLMISVIRELMNDETIPSASLVVGIFETST